MQNSLFPANPSHTGDPAVILVVAAQRVKGRPQALAVTRRTFPVIKKVPHSILLRRNPRRLVLKTSMTDPPLDHLLLHQSNRDPGLVEDSEGPGFLTNQIYPSLFGVS